MGKETIRIIKQKQSIMIYDDDALREAQLEYWQEEVKSQSADEMTQNALLEKYLY